MFNDDGRATAPTAQAATKTLSYNCVFPFVEQQALGITIEYARPTSWFVTVPTPPIDLNVAATISSGTWGALDTVGAATLEGNASFQSTVIAPPPQVIPQLKLPISLPGQGVTDADRNPDGSLTIDGTARLPSLKIGNPGTATISIDSIAINLLARYANGAEVEGLSLDSFRNDFDVLCTDPPGGQDRLLTTVPVIGVGTPTPTPPVPTPTVIIGSPTPTVAPPTPTVTPTPTPTAVIGSPTPTVAPPTPTPTPTPTAVVGSPTPTVAPPTPTPTPIPTPGPDCATTAGETLINYNYALAGSATLKTLVKGSLPLKGGIAAKLGVPSGCFSGDLTLNQSSANLVALGFLPVTATVQILATEKVAGTLRSGSLLANAKVRIKLPVVKLFGLQIGGGASCQAKQISSIALKSTANPFLPTKGGAIAGTFSISDLVGCGALNGIISPLTAGKGNAIVLNLTPNN